MSKTEKCTCKACKTIVFHYQICKFVTFLLPSFFITKCCLNSQREKSLITQQKSEVGLSRTKISHRTWYWAKPGNKRGPTDSPAVFIASAGKKVFQASRYPMLYAFVQLMGFGGQPGATAALCAWPFGSTTRFELRSYPYSIVRPTTTELSVAVSRISVQASIPRKAWNSSWITVRIFTTWKGRHICLV